MRRVKFLLLIGVLIFAVCWKTNNLKTSKQKHNDLIQSAQDEEVTEQMRFFSISGFSETGEKNWYVEGQTANIYDDIIKLDKIKGTVQSEGISVDITADNGIFYRNNSSVQLSSNVVAVTDEGTKLTTETLYWDAKKEHVHTDDYVVITRNDLMIEGIGADAEPNLKKAQIIKDVKVNVVTPPSVITCDGPLEVDYCNNVAYFNKNVNFLDDGVSIDSDNAVAYFEPSNRSFTKVISEGNVKIVRGKNSTFAENLTYLPNEGRTILTGSPKVIINSTEGVLEAGTGFPSASSGKVASARNE